MSAHVVLNLLNGFRKKDSLIYYVKVLLIFSNVLNKFNKIGAQMLGYIYHMTLKLFIHLI